MFTTVEHWTVGWGVGVSLDPRQPEPVILHIFTSRVSGRGNVFRPVCLSIRLSVNTLTAELFDIQT